MKIRIRDGSGLLLFTDGIDDGFDGVEVTDRGTSAGPIYDDGPLEYVWVGCCEADESCGRRGAFMREGCCWVCGEESGEGGRVVAFICVA
jgi:hypothetical protein